ncbi:enoyl-CoA hydratase-related protein [Sporichthya polymorpha]|uniref:enoyl-CoA hydratase-related protein n=1 Tax=Sporichthya polymorpha TaxID=35751 RepID=UPI00048B6A94|nr:enoyl-CoA hydratase-related protein [Sporichthya polymorpha]
MSDPVLVSLDGGVATVTLNRPESFNSLNLLARLLLLDALKSIAEDPAVRAVVLTGAGRGFCVGQDLAEIDPAKTAKERFSVVPEHYAPIAQLLADMDKPVLAAINGPAAGAGLSLALAADFRIASEKASFTTAFTGIALSPDTGMSWYLPRLVGVNKATELLLLNPTLKAPEALEIGLVTQVVAPEDLMPTANALAARLAAGPTRAYGLTRRALRYAHDHELAEVLAKEHELIEEAGATEDHLGAVDAFLNKRKPEFSGR